jgi:hypothetical protein
MQDASTEPLWRELAVGDNASLLRLAPWFGFDWSELSRVPGTVRFAAFTDSQGHPAAACLVQGSDEGARQAIEGCLAAGKSYFTALGAAAASSEIGGTLRITFRSKSAETIYSITPEGSLVAQYRSGDGVDRAAADAETGDAVRILSRFDGESPRGSIERVIGDSVQAPLIRWYVEPLPLLRRFAARDSGAWLESFERQGMAQLQSLAGGCWILPRDGVEFEIVGGVSGAVHSERAVGLVEFAAPQPLNVAAWLGPEIASVTSWRWDFSSAMRSFGSLFDEWTDPGPDGEGLFRDLLDGLRDDPEGPQVDLRADVFTWLGPRVTRIVPAAGADSQRQRGPSRELYEIECRDAARVERALTRFYEGDPSVERQDLAGSVLWSVGENQTIFVEGEGESLSGWRAIALEGERMVLGSDPELVRWAIARSDPTPSHSGWEPVVDWLAKPGRDFSFCRVGRPEESLRETYEELRGGVGPSLSWQADLMRRMLFGAGSDDVVAGKSFAALPEYERVGPVLGQFAFHATPVDGGLSFQAVLLRRETR